MRSTRHLVDPDLLGLLDSFPPYTLTEDILPIVRQGYAGRLAPGGDADLKVETTTRQVPGLKDEPDVTVLVHRPTEGSVPCGGILHIHGGGYVSGSAAAMSPAHRALAAELDCVIVSVEYRLAPETRFPGAVEDCYAALAWMTGAAADLGLDPTRLGVMGESAGGGLAAGLALLARDRREYGLAFQHLIYPMLDDRTCISTDPNPFTGEYIWTAEHNRFGWKCLLGVEPGGPDVSPYAAAARATDLAGLPPTFIATGALDLFVDENLDYARRLIRSAVPTELHVYAGAYHGFHFDAKAAPTRKALRDSTAALARALRAPA
jgi:triacylglycerol lipase